MLASLPDVLVQPVCEELVPVTSSPGLLLKPTTTVEDCPDLDVICVPGGAGIRKTWKWRTPSRGFRGGGGGAVAGKTSPRKRRARR